MSDTPVKPKWTRHQLHEIALYNAIAHLRGTIAPEGAELLAALEAERERWQSEQSPESPECPWPADVWTMTVEQYVKAVPDETLRTAISGLLMRMGWQCCLKQMEKPEGEPEDTRPNRISVFYMHDNHTFTSLKGSVGEMAQRARELAISSPYGMLCDAILLRGDEEIRRVGKCVHAAKELGSTPAWEAALNSDLDVIRILGKTEGEL